MFSSLVSFGQSDRKLFGQLKKRYGKEHRYVVKKYSSRKRFNVSRNKRKKYKELSRIYGKIAKRLLKRAKRRKSRRILKQAQMFARLSAYVTPRDRRSYTVSRKVKKAKRRVKASAYKSNLFTFFSYSTWQSELKFSDNTGTGFTMINTSQGMSIGLGWNYQNAKYNYFFDGSYSFFAKGQGGVDSSSPVDYQPKREMTVFMGGPGILFKSFSEDLDLGLQGLILYRTGVWNSGAATANGYSTDDETLIAGGLVMVSKWKLSDLSFLIKYGKLFGAKSTIFSLNTAYEF